MIAEQFAIVSLMTAGEARAAVITINQHMTSARAILADLYERRGWVALGYTTWDECCTGEFPEWGRTYIHYQVTAGEIERRLTDVHHGERAIPERQLRPLAAIPPDDQSGVWQSANEIAAARDERFTARHAQEAVAEYIEEKAEAMPPRASKFNDGMKSSDSPEWYTPGYIIDRVVAVFETIDLDPCSSAIAQRAIEARRFYTRADDGLTQPWGNPDGSPTRVYMNPPYGDAIVPWVDRLIRAYASGEISAAIALLPGRMETDWFAPLFAYPICFIHGRLKFSESKGSAPFPSVAVYFGSDTRVFYDWFHDLGPIMVPLEPIR